MLNKTQLKKIEDAINDELLKRGITVRAYVKVKTRRTRTKIAIKSNQFNTTPVLFRTCQIIDFGSDITQPEEGKYGNFWVGVNVHWELFSGGTNGTRLFHVMGNFDPNSDSIKIEIKN